jgi:hypothetical protein
MKRILVHPDDGCRVMAEAKAMCAAYGFTFDTSVHCPRGQMLVFDYDDEEWMAYDESRRGRHLPSEQFRIEDF